MIAITFIVIIQFSTDNRSLNSLFEVISSLITI